MQYTRLTARSLLVLALAAALPKVMGQAAETAAPAPAPAPAVETDSEVIELSPFSVSATEDTGYAAKNTLAGTRIRTELKDVGSSVSVVTQQFLDNTASQNAEQLLVYTTNTEVAGQGGNFLGQGDGSVLTNTNRTSPIANTRVRGLTEADNTRDFYLSDIPWDSYNVGRVDLQRGPNSILFGIGSPAGIVNSSLNGAAFKESAKLENKLDNFGSVRFTADYNKVVLKNELAFRIAGLWDDTKYKQDPAYRDDHRFYAAGKYDPSFLKKNGNRTSIMANWEKGNVRSNMPRYTPPLDAITPWYKEMNKQTYDARTSNDASQTQPWLGAAGGRVYDGVVTPFDGTKQGQSYSSSYRAWPNTGGTVPASAVGNNTYRGINTYNAYATAARLPFTSINAYKAKSLTDPTIFDFYNNLLEGPNKREWNDFKAYNLTLTQTFLDDKVGINIAYDKQQAQWGYENFISGDASVITVDIMKTLLDGSVNPNVGRPMTIAGGGSAGGYREERDREVWRGTAFGELDFAQVLSKDSFIAKVFGRNVFTGLLTRQTVDDISLGYNRFYLADAFAPHAAAGSVGQASRDNIFFNYLGGSVSGMSSASGMGLQGIKDQILIKDGTINYYNNVDNKWQMMPVITHNNDLYDNQNKTYRTARKYEDIVDSSALIWQGYWLDNAVIPMFGYRKDTQKFRDAGNPPSAGGLVDVNSSKWVLPDNGTEVSGISRTYSLVTHLPRAWRAKMPGNTDISVFVNQSENFRPDSGRRDIMGHSVANPQGETKEYGAAVTLLDDKLTLKWTHFKTTVANATVTNEIGGQYLIGANEAWGQRAAYKFKNEPGTWPASEIYGYASNGKAVTWRPAGALKGTSGAYTYSQAELDATYTKMQNSINDWFAKQVPTDFQNAWALTNYSSPSYAGDTNYGAAGLVVTGDTISEGDEFELIATPVKGWDVSMNLSKTSAQRTNLAKSYTDWITQRWSDLQGPMGDMRLWGGEDDSSADSTHGGETARGKFSRETMSGYNLWNALQDSDVPELRPYRFNFVTNYSFQGGKLKGFNVGGSYRWSDKSVTGFPVIKDSQGNNVFDVTNPYYGDTEEIIDMWVGYQMKITSKITWRIQLNARNVFGGDELVPVTVQPDGSPGAYRIAEPRSFALTNSFSF